MNKMNNIFKKIAELEKNANEVKLGLHEIELANLDQLLKDFVNAVNKDKESSDIYLVLKTDIARAKQKIQDNSLISERLIADFATFEKQAKELGLNLPQDVKANQDTIKKTINNYLRYLKNLNAIKL